MSRLGRPSKFSDEFKRDAVELVRSSGCPINQVARELGMSHKTLRSWVKAAGRRQLWGRGRVWWGGQGRGAGPVA
ncbi:transposase [Saccharopolyspora elongata]|uniref:Transposase n=1 Tax=Saccharopolyspora elongata TaxID=2530387 RepID=A0A4R4XUB6_9PSEU|nr:hypothetical protein E1288_43850 [Saccharopolyspora elongata]